MLGKLPWPDRVDLGIALVGLVVGATVRGLTEVEYGGVVVIAVSLALLVVPLVKLLWLTARSTLRRGGLPAEPPKPGEVRSQDRENLVIGLGGIGLGAVVGMTVGWDGYGLVLLVLGSAFAVGPAVRLAWIRFRPSSSGS